MLRMSLYDVWTACHQDNRLIRVTWEMERMKKECLSLPELPSRIPQAGSGFTAGFRWLMVWKDQGMSKAMLPLQNPQPLALACRSPGGTGSHRCLPSLGISPPVSANFRLLPAWPASTSGTRFLLFTRLPAVEWPGLRSGELRLH